jgi:uncharacterized damage-inducible protein DinB
METVNHSTAEDIAVKILLKSWTTQVARITDIVTSLSDNDLQKEIAPGKNTGIYILGHMVAVHDAMLPLLGFGSKLYPQLEQIFITSPDKAGHSFPPASDLRKYWSEINDLLLQHYTKFDFEAWLTRHEAVSPEDFVKEPHRNKLNVLISRTTHMSYHHGQLVLLKSKIQD